MGTQKNTSDYNIMYGLVAKTIGKLGRFSVGYYSGNDKTVTKQVTDTTFEQGNNTGVLASWDRTMSEISDKLWLAADYQGGMNGYGALNFGAAWAITPDASFIVGYDIYNNSDFLKPSFTMQVDFNLTPVNEWCKKAAK
jgi:hypothetical protein